MTVGGEVVVAAGFTATIEVILGFVALWCITSIQKEIISYIFIGLTAIFDVAYYIMIINTLIGMIAVIFSLVGNIAYAAAAVMAVKMVYNKTKFYILIWGGLAAVVIGNCFANFELLLVIVPYFLFRFCCLFTLWGPIKFRALHTCPHCGTFDDGTVISAEAAEKSFNAQLRIFRKYTVRNYFGVGRARLTPIFFCTDC